MRREIVLDTETTGLDPRLGHRLVEIACLELANHLPTGRIFQTYLNPERAMSADAEAIHGLGDAFLADQPLFAEKVAALLEFIADSTLVIHNAEFDLGFLNAELGRLGFPPIPAKRAVDTVALARRKYPGQPASLDALCQRLGIDNSKRQLHGARLDAELLAEVYLELVGGRQASIELVAGATDAASAAQRAPRAARAHAPSEAERAAHAALLARLKAPLWTADC